MGRRRDGLILHASDRVVLLDEFDDYLPGSDTAAGAIPDALDAIRSSVPTEVHRGGYGRGVEGTVVQIGPFRIALPRSGRRRRQRRAEGRDAGWPRTERKRAVDCVKSLTGRGQGSLVSVRVQGHWTSIRAGFAECLALGAVDDAGGDSDELVVLVHVPDETATSFPTHADAGGSWPGPLCERR